MNFVSDIREIIRIMNFVSKRVFYRVRDDVCLVQRVFHETKKSISFSNFYFVSFSLHCFRSSQFLILQKNLRSAIINFLELVIIQNLKRTSLIEFMY